MEKLEIKLRPSANDRKLLNELIGNYRQACHDIYDMAAQRGNFTVDNLTRQIYNLPQPFQGMPPTLEGKWGLPAWAVHSAILAVSEGITNPELKFGPKSFWFIDPNWIQMKVGGGQVIDIPVGSTKILEVAQLTPGTEWLSKGLFDFTINRVYDGATTNPPVPPFVEIVEPVEGAYHRSTITGKMENSIYGVTSKPQLPLKENIEIWERVQGAAWYQPGRGAVGSGVLPSRGGVYIGRDPRLSGKMI